MKAANHEVTENISKIPLPLRRLDIFAEMIETTSFSSSVCFDGNELLLAFNSTLSHDFHLQLCSHLSEIARIDYSIPSWHEEYDNKHNLFLEDAEKFFAENSSRRKLKSEGILQREWFEKFKAHLERIEGSIISSIINDNGKINRNELEIHGFKAEMIRPEAAFTSDLVAAFRNNKIKDINKKDKIPSKIHAELRIIDRLLADKKITKESKFYISNSQKCCANCEAAIKAVNTIFADPQVSYDNNDWPSNQILVVRDLFSEGKGHGIKYGNSVPPSFLTKKSPCTKEITEALIKEFCQLREVQNIGEAYGSSKGIDRSKNTRRSLSNSPTNSREKDIVSGSEKKNYLSSDNHDELFSPRSIISSSEIGNISNSSSHNSSEEGSNHKSPILPKPQRKPYLPDSYNPPLDPLDSYTSKNDSNKNLERITPTKVLSIETTNEEPSTKAPSIGTPISTSAFQSTNKKGTSR